MSAPRKQPPMFDVMDWVILLTLLTVACTALRMDRPCADNCVEVSVTR